MSRLVHVLLVIFVLSVGWGPARDSHAQDQQTEVARDVIAAINEVRIAQGTWPLKPNATLEAMALAQAEYLRFVLESAKGCGVDDAAVVALGGRPVVSLSLDVFTRAAGI